MALTNTEELAKNLIYEGNLGEKAIMDNIIHSSKQKE